jgi:hypothetical protein
LIRSGLMKEEIKDDPEIAGKYKSNPNLYEVTKL